MGHRVAHITQTRGITHLGSGVASRFGLTSRRFSNKRILYQTEPMFTDVQESIKVKYSGKPGFSSLTVMMV
jgi:hypothetical protein